MLRQLAGRGLRAHGQLQKVACPAVSRGFADGAPAIQEDEYAFGVRHCCFHALFIRKVV